MVCQQNGGGGSARRQDLLKVVRQDNVARRNQIKYLVYNCGRWEISDTVNDSRGGAQDGWPLEIGRFKALRNNEDINMTATTLSRGEAYMRRYPPFQDPSIPNSGAIFDYKGDFRQ